MLKRAEAEIAKEEAAYLDPARLLRSRDRYLRAFYTSWMYANDVQRGELDAEKAIEFILELADENGDPV